MARLTAGKLGIRLTHTKYRGSGYIPRLVGVDPSFWRGRRVLVTGHTGFKGAWMALWVREMGARVIAEGVPTSPSLYELTAVGEGMLEVRADVRDASAVLQAFAAHTPDIVVHMAAQPFVRRSFREPRETYEVNVMGAANVLEAARLAPRWAALSMSPPTSATRTRLTVIHGLSSRAIPRVLRSWWPRPMGARSSRGPTGHDWPAPRRVASSAAATGARTGWSPPSCAARWRASPSVSATPRPSAPGSTCSIRSVAI